VKHIVVDSRGAVMVPAKCEYPAKDNRHQSVSFETVEDARSFAEFMARKHREQEFCVFAIVATVKTVEPPVQWTELDGL
jgi:hypothetical protein